jgi:hypothetical protein
MRVVTVLCARLSIFISRAAVESWLLRHFLSPVCEVVCGRGYLGNDLKMRILVAEPRHHDPQISRLHALRFREVCLGMAIGYIQKQQPLGRVHLILQ